MRPHTCGLYIRRKDKLVRKERKYRTKSFQINGFFFFVFSLQNNYLFFLLLFYVLLLICAIELDAGPSQWNVCARRARHCRYFLKSKTMTQSALDTIFVSVPFPLLSHLIFSYLAIRYQFVNLSSASYAWHGSVPSLHRTTQWLPCFRQCWTVMQISPARQGSTVLPNSKKHYKNCHCLHCDTATSLRACQKTVCRSGTIVALFTRFIHCYSKYLAFLNIEFTFDCLRT